jgi:hypothetical protein
MDVLPTPADLAGIRASPEAQARQLDGVSLKPLLDSPDSIFAPQDLFPRKIFARLTMR